MRPLGFDAWINTWLWRFRDVYLVTWKLDVEEISVDDLPASAFDSPEQKARLAEIFEEYNNTLTWSREQDRELGEIARERTAQHPLRTYLKVPLLRCADAVVRAARGAAPCFRQPVAGPGGVARRPARFLTSLSVVGINGIYIALALAGAWMSRRRPGWALLIVFILVRTIYFAAFADEAPEPRYVLECFPAVLALGAQVFRGRRQLSSTGSG